MHPFLYSLAVYVLSALAMELLTRHALRNWGQAYLGRERPTTLTQWHPVYANNWFSSRYPHRGPCNQDLLASRWMTFVPGLNTLMLLVILLMAGIEAGYGMLRRQLLQAFFGGEDAFQTWKQQRL